MAECVDCLPHLPVCLLDCVGSKTHATCIWAMTTGLNYYTECLHPAHGISASWVKGEESKCIISLHVWVCSSFSGSYVHIFLTSTSPELTRQQQCCWALQWDRTAYHSAVKPDPLSIRTSPLGEFAWTCSVKSQRDGTIVTFRPVGSSLTGSPSGPFLQFDVRANNRVREQARDTPLDMRPP